MIGNRPLHCVVWRFALALGLLAPTGAATATPRSSRDSVSEELVAACIGRAAGGQAWLEKTLWGLRDQEGGWVGAEVRNSDGSHDLGPLQVNSWWVSRIAVRTGQPPAQVRWWLTNDACFNVQAARWIFLSSLATAQDYWLAIGVYHSGIHWRQRRYALSVAGHLRRRFGPTVFGSRISTLARIPSAGHDDVPRRRPPSTIEPAVATSDGSHR